MYYRNKEVQKIVRTYFYGDTLYAEILIDGETLYVKYSDLKAYKLSISDKPKNEDKLNETDRESEQNPEYQYGKELKDSVYVATDKNGNETTFRLDDPIVIKNKWHIPSIINVVQGKQKKHLGYTFRKQ